MTKETPFLRYGGVIAPIDDPKPVESGASRWTILRGRLRQSFGSILNRMRFPALIRQVEIKDDLSGQSITLRTGPLLTRLTVNGRDYYFDRLTGKFDGAGSGCGR